MGNIIRLKTNQPSLILNLRHAFTPNSMLGELLQNARRAGTHNISIEVDDDSITVTDDGCGIADLQTLIFIAESGWDEELQRRENAFGMGVLSTLYFCDHLSVHSGDKAFEARTADIIAGEPIEVSDMDHRAGTCIRLEGVKSNQTAIPLPEWVERQLQLLCEAFPVPVSFNGVEIDRPLANPSLPWRETEVGRVLIDLEASHWHWRCFLQGLPIGSLPRSTHKHMVLLRDDMIARLPDRQHLLDEENENPRIQAAVSQAYRDALIEAKTEMGAGPFLAAYGDTCLGSSNADLLNDIPFAKLSWFRDWDQAPPGFLPDWYGSAKEDIIGADAFAADSVWRNDAEYEDAPTTESYVFARDGFLLEEGRLDSNHWLLDKVNVISPEQVVVHHGVVLHESEHVPVVDDGLKFTLVDKLSLSHVDDPRQYPVSAVRVRDTIHLTPRAQGVSWLVSDYILDERYDDEARHSDEEAIRTFVLIGRSQTPVSVLHALLPSSLRYSPQPKLANATVRLVFDGEGRLQSISD